ncbi:MAG: hypothetical protein ACRDU0_15565, partial [Mycobacterium sp.]
MVVWAALSGWQLWKAVQDARAGLDAVKVARTRESAIDVVKQSTLAPLALAQADFAAARSHLDFPLLVPIRIGPVLGRQYGSVRAMAGAAEQAAAVGQRAILQAHQTLGLPHSAGPDRVATLRRLGAIAATADASLAGLDLGPSDGLIAALGTRRA